MTANLVRTPGMRARFAWVQWVASGLVAFCFSIAILKHLLRDDFHGSARNVAWLMALTAGLCPAAWWLWFRFVSWRLNEYSRRSRIVWHVGAMLVGGWLVVAIPLSPAYCWAKAVGIGFIVLVGSVWTATRPALTSNPEVSRWAWLGYALPPGLYWSYFLWVFWPAIISPDSVYQWNQIANGGYGDDHPTFHTFFIWLMTRAWHSPAAVAMAQIVLLSLVIGLALAWMRRQGMPRWMAIAVCCLLALAPANGLLVITLWKDILYSTALLAMVVVMLAIVQTEGRWLGNRLSWLWLAIPAIVVWLCRHNGLPIVVAVFLVLPLAYRRQWRPILLSLLVCAVSIVMVKGPLYRAVGVQPVSRWLKAAPYLHHIAAHLAAKTPIRPEEQAVLDQIIPPEGGNTWPYHPYNVAPTYQARGINLAAISRNLPELAKIFWALTWRRPSVAFEHAKNGSRIVWQVQDSPVILAAIYFENHQAMRFDPALLESNADTAKFEYSPVERPAPPGIERSYSQKYHWLAWRPALWMYLFLGGCVVAGIRSRTWKYALVALPIVVQEAVMVVFGLATDFRYHWGAYLAGILLSGYLLLATARREAKSLSSGDETIIRNSQISEPILDSPLPA